MAYTEADFTPDFCRHIVTEHGSIEGAAQIIAPTCINKFGGPAAWRTVRDWVRAGIRAGAAVEGMGLTKPADPDRTNRVDELLDRVNTDLGEIGAIERVRVKAWGIGAVDRETGKLVTEGLHATDITLRPKGPTWRPVSPAADVTITGYRPVTIERGCSERVFIVGDIQAGYLRTPDGVLTAFHDEAALDVQLQAIRVFRPHRIVIIGDALDFAELSKYRQDPTFALTMQPAIDFLYAYLLRIRKMVGSRCVMEYIAGNHEARLTNYIVDNARAIYGLRPGGGTPEDWPLMSVPTLLRLEELGIAYSAEYPAGEIYLTRRGAPRPLLCAHTRPNDRKDRRASVIHGHEVELSAETWTIHTDDGEKAYERWCIPGTGNYGEVKADKTRPTRTVTPSNRTRISATQAFGLVYIDRKTQDWLVMPVPIRKGRVIMPTGETLTGNAKTLAVRSTKAAS